MKTVLTIMFIFFNIFIVSATDNDLKTIYEISEGEELNSVGQKISSFEMMYNELGLLIEFKQSIYQPNEEFYISTYLYDEYHRLVKMINFYDNKKISENNIHYNIEDNIVTLINTNGDNTFKEIYYYEKNNLIKYMTIYNDEIQSEEEVIIEKKDNIINIKYVTKDRTTYTKKVLINGYNINKIILNGESFNYAYNELLLTEKKTKDITTIFKIIEIQSVKKNSYNFLKDFFNIRKINLDEW